LCSFRSLCFWAGGQLIFPGLRVLLRHGIVSAWKWNRPPFKSRTERILKFGGGHAFNHGGLDLEELAGSHAVGEVACGWILFLASSRLTLVCASVARVDLPCEAGVDLLPFRRSERQCEFAGVWDALRPFPVVKELCEGRYFKLRSSTGPKRISAHRSVVVIASGSVLPRRKKNLVLDRVSSPPSELR
jgi:hypothetical protein